MESVILILIVINLIMLLFVIALIRKTAQQEKGVSKTDFSELKKLIEILGNTNENQNKQLMDQSVRMSDSVVSQISLLGSELRKSQETQQQRSAEVLERIESEMKSLNRENHENLEKIRTSNAGSMEKLRIENQQSLDRMSDSVVSQISLLSGELHKSQETQQQRSAEVLERIESEMKSLNRENHENLEKIRTSNAGSMEKLRIENQQSLDRMSDSVVSQISLLSGELHKSQEIQQQRSAEVLERIESEMKSLNRENHENLEKIRTSNAESMEKLRIENQQSLDKINDTVNEKLQKTLDDKISRSFETVSKRLTEVYEGLGEMKNVASGVSDLKNVLSNVKTRGIMGEIQLGAILDEILAPEQYGSQIPVVPRSAEKVDFAVKLPGNDNGEFIYLPIDSKFPGDTYANLLSAYESGNPAELKNRRSALDSEIKRCAKSISDKYIKPPYTTDFAIMFLPFEGLYAEVVNMGLVEILQRDYRINIAGPSTMAAMLNSLQMGFRTLAVHKKSGEVWKILESAKKEFGKFQQVLESTRNRLRQADEDLEKLIGTRTRAINRQLKTITETDSESDIDTD